MTTGMGGVAGQLEEDYLTCQICFDIYQQPKALPCLHSFCLECLDLFIEAKKLTNQDATSFSCPICRRDIDIPADGAKGFFDNHILISLADTLANLSIQQDDAEWEDITELLISNEGEQQEEDIYRDTLLLSALQTDTNVMDQFVAPSAPPDECTSIHRNKTGSPRTSASPSAHPDDSRSIQRPRTGRPETASRRIGMPDLKSIADDVHALPGFICSFGQFGYSFNDMTYPIGLAITSDGYVIVSDQRDNRILVYDILGNFCNQFQCGENVRTITTGEDGDSIIIAVSNIGQAPVHRYKLNGTKVQTLGNIPGSEHPHGIAYSKKLGVVVSMLDSCVIYTLNMNGKLLQKFGTKGDDITNIMTPYHVTINPKGDILVSDCACHAIKVFSHVGNCLFHFGGSLNDPQELCHPKGLCLDSNGNVIVADFGNHCVKRFSPTGSLIDKVIEFPQVEPVNQLRPINVALYEDKIVVLVVGVYNANIIVCHYNHLEVQSNQPISRACSII